MTRTLALAGMMFGHVLCLAACGNGNDLYAPLAVDSKIQPLQATNLASNGSFETVGPNGPSTTWAASGSSNAAAAAGWSMVSPFGAANLSTQQDSFAAPNGGSKTLHVVTDRQSSGIVQVLGPLGSGPSSTVSTIQVYVTRGQVGFGVGDGGNTGIGSVSTSTGRWETLVVPNHSTASNEIILYATSVGGADFYVDNMGF